MAGLPGNWSPGRERRRGMVFGLAVAEVTLILAFLAIAWGSATVGAQEKQNAPKPEMCDTACVYKLVEDLREQREAVEAARQQAERDLAGAMRLSKAAAMEASRALALALARLEGEKRARDEAERQRDEARRDLAGVMRRSQEAEMEASRALARVDGEKRARAEAERQRDEARRDLAGAMRRLQDAETEASRTHGSLEIEIQVLKNTIQELQRQINVLRPTLSSPSPQRLGSGPDNVPGEQQCIPLDGRNPRPIVQVDLLDGNRVFVKIATETRGLFSDNPVWARLDGMDQSQAITQGDLLNMLRSLPRPSPGCIFALRVKDVMSNSDKNVYKDRMSQLRSAAYVQER